MSPTSRNRKSPKDPRSRSKKSLEQNVKDIEVHAAGVEHHSFSYRSAPIPTPDDFLNYAKVDPSFPNRIMSMAEKQQRASNRSKFFENIAVAILTFSGQLFAFTALLGILYLIYLAINEGSEIGKYLTIGAAGIISVFIYARSKRTPK